MFFQVGKMGRQTSYTFFSDNSQCIVHTVETMHFLDAYFDKIIIKCHNTCYRCLIYVIFTINVGSRTKTGCGRAGKEFKIPNKLTAALNWKTDALVPHL